VIEIDLSGRVALVTGGSRGLGRADTLTLARAGADVVIVDIQVESDAGDDAERYGPLAQAARAQGFVYSEATAKEISELGRRSAAIKCDVTDRAQVEETVRRVVDEFGSVDILVNNAGTIQRTPALDHSDEQWRRVLQTNLTSAFVLARELAWPMVERGRGKIVFTASMLSFQGGINVVSYTAAKSGLAGLVRALANEWAPHGVNVNAIAPGYLATDNTQALRDDPERSGAILERIPAGRWGEPADVAGATVFLSSPASDYVHGIVLPVDGGWLGR